MRKLTFTPIAEKRLEAISEWTFQRFGPRQAGRYEEEIVARCAGIASGTVPSQNCSVLTETNISTPLRFARTGKHMIIFLEYHDRCVVVELLHSSSDLAAHVADLALLYS